MKIRIKASLLGVKLSVGFRHGSKTNATRPATRTELQLVEQSLADLETYVVEKIGGEKIGAEETRLGFGFATVAEDNMDPEETLEEWFEDDDEEYWEED